MIHKKPHQVDSNYRATIESVQRNDGDKAACFYIVNREKCELPEAVEFLLKLGVLSANPFTVEENNPGVAAEEAAGVEAGAADAVQDEATEGASSSEGSA